MRLCLPLSFLKSTSNRRRRSKEVRLDPEEQPFTYFSVEPSQTLYAAMSTPENHLHYHDLSHNSSVSSRSLQSIPKTDRFRSVYAWLQSQESVVPCCSSCCLDRSPDSQYACTDVTRSAVSYCPDRDTYGSCIPDRGTFSPELRGIFSSPDTPVRNRCQSATASMSSEHYSCPDTRRRGGQSSGSLGGSSPVPLSPRDDSLRVRPQHVRTVSLPSENTEYIYLDFGRGQQQQPAPRQTTDSWHITRKPVQSPVRRSYA